MRGWGWLKDWGLGQEPSAEQNKQLPGQLENFFKEHLTLFFEQGSNGHQGNGGKPGGYQPGIQKPSHLLPLQGKCCGKKAD